MKFRPISGWSGPGAVLTGRTRISPTAQAGRNLITAGENRAERGGNYFFAEMAAAALEKKSSFWIFTSMFFCC